MSTMNISLPEALKAFVDEQVTSRGYGTSSEYVRDLIRQDREREKARQIEKLRQMLLDGANSGPGRLVDDAFFEDLREIARGRKPE